MVRKLLFIPVLIVAAIFGTGASTANKVMHPVRREVAEVCPCIAHVSCRAAAVAGDQHGWYFTPDNPNGGAILMLHGVGATRTDMIPLGAVFLRAGYSILTPDLRGSGRSGGLVSFGDLERQDVHAWADWLLKQKGVSRLYGFGVSLGGSVMLESLDYEKRFRAIVSESAYSDFPTVAVERTKLGWLTVPFVGSGLLWARLRYGVDMWHPSAVDSVRRSHTPILVVHGLADDETLPDHSRRIAAANPNTTQLWLIPNARHATAWATAGKVFESRVLSFYGAH